MKGLLASAVAAFVALGVSKAGAGEITLIAPGGVRAAVEQAIVEFESRTGDKVKATFGSGGKTKEEEVKPKIRTGLGGAASMALVAKGEIDFGLTFISEILTEPGVEVVGPLPREISTPTGFVAFVSAHAKEADGAKALIAFLGSPQAAAIFKAKGLEPGG